MRISADNYVSQVKRNNAVQDRFRKVWRILSLLVVLSVFWGLKLTGITMAGEAFCGMEEHSHGETCELKELICEMEESPGHIHTEICLNKTLQCTLPEQKGHTHGEECITKTLICSKEETAGHTHSEACITDELICTQAEAEAHLHGDGCYADRVVCGLEESGEHTHGAECIVSELICDAEETEGHSHGLNCYFMICDQEEAEEHFHGEDCYIVDPGYLCGEEEVPGHFHTEACYTVDESNYLCGLEQAEGHAHGENCYRILDKCPIAEHVHTETCYSDISADIETSDVWEESLAELIRSPSDAENIIMVARSQLGMSESTLNFQVDENGIRRGITRYGQWYGNPYGDWSAMFASFCLDYAGIQEIPMNAGPETMRLEWESAQLYAGAADHVPEPGQLLFLDKDGDGAADAIAIITGLEENVLFVIEGDLDKQVTEIGSVKLYPDEQVAEFASDSEQIPEEISVPATDSVMETLYAMDEPVVMGYGLVPFGSGLLLLPEGGIDPRAPSCTIWLDGTNGGLMSLGGSDNTRYTAEQGTKFTLPTQWRSPDKYSYTLRGWYDVTNNKYYAPGDEVTVTGNMVFYADWMASTYDVGQFNSQVNQDTISTKDFVTIRMFDYGALFNVLSQRADVSFGNNSHTETWNLITSGNNPYNGQPTLNYILRDWDRGSEDISYPTGVSDGSPHYPTAAGEVYPGLYTDAIRNAMFDPDVQIPGKYYVGEGDYLFQLCLDPSHDHYGYYYYNSERNAASYNQTDQRFYVYDYLECTRTSSTSGDANGKMSDFLPFNSPYANTNGKRVNTYSYNGVEGEYSSTTHYMFDCRYNDSDNSPNYAGTNFWYGMSVDVDFYLPNAPATLLPDGYGNQDMYGKDMHFRFSGDDDVWIFIDKPVVQEDGTTVMEKVMVLDLGGLHGMETGDINFASGVVTINGVVNETLSNNLKSIGAGEHTLTLYYLERGSSMSNCAIYFNLAPRFSFNIQKEDVLTRDVLNGAQFSVYTDAACTVPAQLWTSKTSHDQGDESGNQFTVENGIASMWGMGAGNTYYIKETKGPDDPNYTGFPDGVIRLTFDKHGTADYDVQILGDVSPGFTIHGIRIDREEQQAYIIATNAPKWVDDTTSVQVKKYWQDGLEHNAEEITVYLNVTDQKGQITRLQEIRLGSSNNWSHRWENLPKFWPNGDPIVYSVEESYIPGYYGKVERKTESYTVTSQNWQETSNLEDGKTYILGTPQGYLSTNANAEDTGFMWVDEQTAKSSPQALWTVNRSGNTFRLINEAGQIITFYYGNGSPTDFFAYKQYKDNSDSNYKQFLSGTASGNSVRLYFDAPNGRDYYLAAMMSNGKFDDSTNSSSGIIFTPKTLVTTTTTVEVTSDWAYLITNSPLDQETFLAVEKRWDYGYLGQGTEHEQLQVTVKLLANGKDTGRTVILSLKNGWRDIFQGLPYVDENGNVISYSVVESWDNADWVPYYGEIVIADGTTPSYSTVVVNRYRWGMGGPELPSTGTAARMLYILCGGSIMLTSLVYGILLRRKRERRMK